MIVSGSPFDYLIAFFGGVLFSFTPCVFPLLPVSLAYIGVSSSGSRLRGLFLGVSYVTGLAVTYSLLGIIASLSGSLFGRVSSHPLTQIIVGVLIVIFGLAMLDLFKLPFPNIIRPIRQHQQSYLSAFILGLASGLVVSSCLTPVLSSILLILAVKKNILYGATLLFSFAYGLGFILLIAGFFSSTFFSLLKPGRWLVLVKRFSALIVLAVGLYFIYSGIREIY